MSRCPTLYAHLRTRYPYKKILRDCTIRWPARIDSLGPTMRRREVGTKYAPELASSCAGSVSAEGQCAYDMQDECTDESKLRVSCISRKLTHVDAVVHHMEQSSTWISSFVIETQWPWQTRLPGVQRGVHVKKHIIGSQSNSKWPVSAAYCHFSASPVSLDLHTRPSIILSLDR
jgi:hypothetical protein